MGLVRTLAGLFDVVTIVSAVIGGFIAFSGLVPGQSAIQTGAAAAMGVAFAAVPYCIAGALHRASMRDLQMRQLDMYES